MSEDELIERQINRSMFLIARQDLHPVSGSCSFAGTVWIVPKEPRGASLALV